MNSSTRKLVIAPAREGPKRLPGKNLAPLNGKPLIYYTLEAVTQSLCFQKTMLLSDDVEILTTSEKISGITPEKRQASLAGDTVKVIDLVHPIAKGEDAREGLDVIGRSLLACPLRTTTHIQEGLELLSPNDYSAGSVSDLRDPGQPSVTIGQDQGMNPEATPKPSPLVTGETRPRDAERADQVNGGLYIAWRNKPIERDDFFRGQVKADVMDDLYSADRDDEMDLKWAEFLLSNDDVKIETTKHGTV